METLMKVSFSLPGSKNREAFMESSCLSSKLCFNNSFWQSSLCKHGIRRSKGLKIQAVDAAQAFDFESRKLQELQMQKKLKIGLVGFGNYGQFLAETMVKQGHTVLAHSRSDYSQVGRKMKVQFFRDADDFCEEHPEVIVLCTSILSTEGVLQALPVQRLRRSTLFVDVLSVKEFPRNLLLQNGCIIGYERKILSCIWKFSQQNLTYYVPIQCLGPKVEKQAGKTCHLCSIKFG